MNTWDEQYKKAKGKAFSGEPVDVVKDALQYIEKGTVLDMGGGGGRNAIFLAQHGFDVTAVDISETGLEQVRTDAHKEGVEVATQQQKLEDFAFSTTYDMVVCTFALHTVSPEAALGFIEDAKNPTAAGGIHVITVITNQGDFCQCTHEHGEQLFYPPLGKLKELYSDWTIHHYTEKESKAALKRPDGTPMRNTTSSLITQKP